MGSTLQDKLDVSTFQMGEKGKMKANQNKVYICQNNNNEVIHKNNVKIF